MYRSLLYAALFLLGACCLYAIIYLLNRATGKRKWMSRIQLGLGAKLLAVFGVLGCSTVIDEDPGSRPDPNDTADGDTDSDTATDTDTGSSTDTALDQETDQETDQDTSRDTDTADTGDTDSEYDIMCYEKVAVPADEISIGNRPSGAVIEPANNTVSGLFSVQYAAIPSYRLVTDDGEQIDFGNISGSPTVDSQMQFTLFLPDDLEPGMYSLFLYGTTIENVEQYDTYAAKQYLVEVP